MKKSGIYSAIHRESEKCYVGSSVDIDRRIKQHIYMSTHGGTGAFSRALREFGEDAFDFEILENCEKKDFMERERFYIAFLNAASVDGFNTHSDPRKPRDEYKHHAASRERMSVARKRRVERKSPKVLQRMANMRDAKERKRIERNAGLPPRVCVKGKLAYTITIHAHISGATHTMTLTVSPKRIDQYSVEVDGKPWKKRVGMSHVTAGIRKALPPFRRVNRET